MTKYRVLAFVMFFAAGSLFAQTTTVTASVVLVVKDKKVKSRDASNVVVWLNPTDAALRTSASNFKSSPRPRLVQKDKSFQPHILVVPVGSWVEFPNRDPFFHNVFSLFEGKRFDLGLYEAGSTRDVLFDKPGISYIFCNIHAEMSAVIIALNTPYYAISDRRGQLLIPDVPPGQYSVRIWYEGSLPDVLGTMTREITISQNTSTLGVFRVPASGFPQEHKNLYGKDYTPPAPTSPTYEHP